MARKKSPGARTPAKPAGAEAARPASDPAPATPSHPAGSRRRLGILACAILALAGIGAALWFSRSPAPAGAASLPPPLAAAEARYVGGAECAACHAKQAEAWKGSDHDLAMQVANDKSMLGDFSGAKFSYAGTTSTFSRRDGKYFVNTDGPDGKLADYEIRYAFGVRPLQQYLIEFPGGRMQALSIAWDSRPKAEGGQRWFHLYPDRKVKAGDWLHWTSTSQNWNFTCAECHSTNLRKNFDAGTGTFKTTWSELNVSCEACHGPGSNHVAWAKKAGDWQAIAGKGLALALDERKGVKWEPEAGTGDPHRSTPRKTSREIDMCARCHARASRISDDYVHGKPPMDTHRLTRLDDSAYWPDGQMRDEVYNWGSFVQSKMHAEGVTCSDCHEPHTLKLRAPGNAVCTQCHQAAKFDDAKHTHHAAGTPGAACANCHMPTTTYMVVDPRHDHSLRVPRPDLSVKLGTPNACNKCHAKQSPQWAAAAIAKWTGKPPSGYQTFAEALQAGNAGAANARALLQGVAGDKAQPALVRASAIDRLGRLLDPATVETVDRALDDPDPVVRLAAVEALGNADPGVRQRFLPRRLDDPVRAVRIEAARALAGTPEKGLAESRRADFARALDEYIAAQAYNADRPEGRMNLGNLYLQRGDTAAAIVEYRKAIAIDPTFEAAYTNLADLYRGRGAESEAEAVLRQGLTANPRSAVIHYTLGLTLVRQKRKPESLKELEAAARLAPESARFAYVYSVALNDAGQSREAVKVLESALARNGNDRDLLSGLAYFTAQGGDRARAQGYVKRLRELDPANPDYVQLEKQFK
jgi:predicted CXXCH cytochrome family protein